jgi:hypothetical protein
MRGLLTPVRLLLALVVVGASVVGLYGLVVTRNLPMTVSGLTVAGIGLAALSIVAAAAAVRAGRNGAGGRALGAALFGGLCALAASGALAMAIVFGLLAASA